jgi:hypothetical protein
VRDVGLAEEVVELRVEAREPDAGTDAERVREHARAPVLVDGDHVRRVLASLADGLERLDQGENTVGGAKTGEPGETRQELRDARQAGTRGDPPAHVLDESGVAPERAIAREVVGGEHDTVETQEPLGERTAVHARRALVGERLDRLDEAGLVQHLARAERVAVAGEEVGAAVERVQLAQHRERARMHLGQRHTRPGELARRLAEPRPGEAPQALPELAESGRKSWYRT